MRKSLLGVIVMLVSVMLPVAFLYASVDKDFEVAIVTVSGDVKVDPDGTANWVPAVVGMRLKTGAKIKTGNNSLAEIVYDAEGLNIVNIDENTEAIVKTSSMDLPGGSVLVKFDNLKNGSEFIVKTPTSACGIRGSGMGVDYISGMTVVLAFEHSVFVWGLDQQGNPTGGAVTIPEGWKTSVAQNGTPEPPVALTDNERRMWEAWVAVITGEPSASEEGDHAAEEAGTEEEKDILDTKDISEKKDISPSQ